MLTAQEFFLSWGLGFPRALGKLAVKNAFYTFPHPPL